MEIGNNQDQDLIELLNFNSEPKSETISASESEWTSEEVICLLKLIKEYGYISQLEKDDDQVYVKLSKLMTVSGFERSRDEVKLEWSDLLDKYNNEGTKFDYYDEVAKLLKEGNETTEIIIIKGDGDTDNNYNGFTWKDKSMKKWARNETNCLFEILEKYGLPTRRTLHKIINLAYNHLTQYGFDRTREQIHFRIKNLKACYYRVQRRKLNKSCFPYYDRVKALLEDYKQIVSTERSQDLIPSDEPEHNSIEGEDDDDDDKIDGNEISINQRRQIWSDQETHTLMKFIEDRNIVTGKCYICK